jgi:glycosyltransferase involved in cell wall biosynthesis
MKAPRISVVVTAYNHENYIAQCLDSILIQKGAFDLEVILGDDCSTDRTRQIMQEYTERHPDIFILLPTAANMGVTKNIKRCLDACSGDYIAFCEGDDYWIDRYKLRKQMEFLESHSDYSMCFNAIMLYYEDEKKYVAHTGQLMLTRDTLTIEDLIKTNVIGNFSCCMYRTDTVRKLPDELFDISTWDWMFNMACSRLGKIGFIGDWMSVYRIRPHGAWSGKSRVDQRQSMIAAIDSYDQFFDYEYHEQFRKLKNKLAVQYGDSFKREVPLWKKYGGLLIHAIKHPRKAYNGLLHAFAVALAELTTAAVQRKDAEIAGLSFAAQTMDARIAELSSAVQARDARIAALNSLVHVIDRKLYTDLKELLSEIKIDFGGGCSLEKAYIMAWLIANFKLKSTVDIGVYRGRSLFPQALAHKRFSNGIVYGIDPWNNELARENDNKELKESIDDFLAKTDLSEIGREVSRYNFEKGFNDYCVLIQKKSEDAIAQFKDKNIIFDLIHIDGNHDTEMVMKDIDLYLPLLTEKGFVVMDDITWDSVKPAFDAVNSKYSLLYKKRDLDDDYAIFWKNNNKSEIAQLTSDIKCIIKGIITFRT